MTTGYLLLGPLALRRQVPLVLPFTLVPIYLDTPVFYSNVNSLSIILLHIFRQFNIKNRITKVKIFNFVVFSSFFMAEY